MIVVISFWVLIVTKLGRLERCQSECESNIPAPAQPRALNDLRYSTKYRRVWYLDLHDLCTVRCQGKMIWGISQSSAARVERRDEGAWLRGYSTLTQRGLSSLYTAWQPSGLPSSHSMKWSPLFAVEERSTYDVILSWNYIGKKLEKATQKLSFQNSLLKQIFKFNF